MRRLSPMILLCLMVCLGVVLFASAAGKTGSTVSGVAVNLFNSVVDEQTNIGCPSTLVNPAYLFGDSTPDQSAIGPTSAYTMSPWPQLEANLKSVAYANGADCSPTSGTCLAANLNKNNTVVSIDTRNSYDWSTGKPRNLVLNFAQPCAQCAYGPGPTNPFGASPVATPGLLSVFLTVSYTSMAICSTTDCPESETGTARFWFDDPSGNKNQSWRVDWGFVRVLRVASNTWYIVADGCDGSQVATLYRLASSRKGTSTSRQGQYLMPFFASTVQ